MRAIRMIRPYPASLQRFRPYRRNNWGVFIVLERPGILGSCKRGISLSSRPGFCWRWWEYGRVRAWFPGSSGWPGSVSPPGDSLCTYGVATPPSDPVTQVNQLARLWLRSPLRKSGTRSKLDALAPTGPDRWGDRERSPGALTWRSRISTPNTLRCHVSADFPRSIGDPPAV